FIKESVERNKNLVQNEEKIIQELIRKDSTSKYYQSALGFWYKYHEANTNDTLVPKKVDVVKLDFEIFDMNHQLIYSKEDTVPKVLDVVIHVIMDEILYVVKLKF